MNAKQDSRTVYIVQRYTPVALGILTLGVFDSWKEMYAFIKDITGGSRKKRKELVIMKAKIGDPDSIEYM